MQKIMFNDKYGLTQAVLEGRKTMTRREIKDINVLYGEIRTMRFSHIDKDGDAILRNSIGFAKMPPRYKVGEIVAIAQAYSDVLETMIERHGGYGEEQNEFYEKWNNKKPWQNKMLVRADLMPHHIKITDIKVEHLQDISNDDCLREGVDSSNSFEIGYGVDWVYQFSNDNRSYFTPREAFARLIDKVSGKGTWERNSWVFAYSFERVD